MSIVKISQWDEGYAQFVREMAQELDCPADNEYVLRKIYALMDLAKKVSQAYDSKPDHWCSCGQCQSFKDHAEDVLEGYFWRTET